jgi:hypothetical protein
MKIFPKVLFKVLLLAILSLSIGSTASAQGADGGSAGAVQASDSYVISPLDYLRVALFVADEVQFQTDTLISRFCSIQSGP